MTTATLTNPPDIAREAIKQLALRRMPPTPDNYARLYGEVSGVMEGIPRPLPEGPDAIEWTEALREFMRAWDGKTPGYTQARKRETIDRLLERRSPNAKEDRKSTRLNSSHLKLSRMPSSA